jgi:prephenate dehydratase
VELVPCQTIVDVLDEFDSGTIDKGVVPIENTIEGSIHLTVDRLAQSPDLFVQGEVILSVTQCLLGLEGTMLDGIREVWSIPPAIAQCRRFIKKIGATVIHFDSTAAAAAEVKKSSRTGEGRRINEYLVYFNCCINYPEYCDITIYLLIY